MNLCYVCRKAIIAYLLFLRAWTRYGMKESPQDVAISVPRAM